jgi:hypothetical protein
MLRHVRRIPGGPCLAPHETALHAGFTTLSRFAPSTFETRSGPCETLLRHATRLIPHLAALPRPPNLHDRPHFGQASRSPLVRRASASPAGHSRRAPPRCAASTPRRPSIRKLPVWLSKTALRSSAGTSSIHMFGKVSRAWPKKSTFGDSALLSPGPHPPRADGGQDWKARESTCPRLDPIRLVRIGEADSQATQLRFAKGSGRKRQTCRSIRPWRLCACCAFALKSRPGQLAEGGELGAGMGRKQTQGARAQRREQQTFRPSGRRGRDYLTVVFCGLVVQRREGCQARSAGSWVRSCRGRRYPNRACRRSVFACHCRTTAGAE